MRQKFRTRSHFTLGQLKVDENQVSAARMADDAITPRRRQYVGHWREWPTDTPPVHRRQHMLGHAVRPVSDKYAFQATDKRTTNEQTNKMRSPSRKATVFAARLNPLDSKGNYSAASNNTRLVHWPLMGGLLHLLVDDPPFERRAVAISSCHGQIGSSETEHSVSPLHECGIDCQPTSDSCVRRRHSGAILRHFYSLLLTELR